MREREKLCRGNVGLYTIKRDDVVMVRKDDVLAKV